MTDAIAARPQEALCARCAIRRLLRCSKQRFLCDGPGASHNCRQPYGEGRSTTRLARDRDIAAHHLTEPPADDETEAGATVFARGA